MGNSSENIFTAYKKAAEAVTRLELWQDKLTAWQMVADFCCDGGNCPLESKPARDTVLFWTYNNMGNLAAENDPDVSRAVEYYRNALPFSPRQYDRITVYRKIARLYKQAGDICRLAGYGEENHPQGRRHCRNYRLCRTGPARE